MKYFLHFGIQWNIVRARKASRLAEEMKEVFRMLAVIGVCGAAYLAGMVYMTVSGMKE